MNHLNQAISLVVSYLTAMEARDLDAARSLVMAEGLELVSPGDRRFDRIDDIVKYSAEWYRFVKKRITARDAWQSGDVVRVLISGTLHGEWPDGTQFEGIRFVDWFELRDGKIAKQHVWNDTGQRLIAMQKEVEK